MASLNTMVKRCSGLVGTKDLSAWEERFVQSIFERTQNGDNTSSLSESQINVLESIFEKHFEG